MMEHIYVTMSRRQRRTITGFWRIGRANAMAFHKCYVSADNNVVCGKKRLVLVTGYNFAGRVVNDFATSNICGASPLSTYTACSVSYVS